MRQLFCHKQYSLFSRSFGCVSRIGYFFLPCLIYPMSFQFLTGKMLYRRMFAYNGTVLS